jgi:D-serine deaminase-like pyridoxal phosphate-dependent protein
MTAISELDTPALLVDLDRMEGNIERWQRLADDAGIRFRVHVKTHKVPEIAKRQLAAGACGIVCAKVAEAEVFVDAGCDDVVVAYPVFGVEIAHDALDELSGLCGTVERLGGVELAGITTHRQLAYAEVGDRTPDQAGRDEGERLVAVAESLRERGHTIREVAAGGSISGHGVVAAPGVTELRAGTYVFNDLMQLAAGSASEDDLALTVLCTVVSTRQPGGATVDGGAKTFSLDRGAIDGFARAIDRQIVLDRFSEEHGMGVVGPEESVTLGEKIRFLPTHACTAVNLADELYGIRAGTVETVWPILARGKRT